MLACRLIDLTLHCNTNRSDASGGQDRRPRSRGDNLYQNDEITAKGSKGL